MKKLKVIMLALFVFMAFSFFTISANKVYGIEYQNPDSWEIPAKYAFRARLTSGSSVQRFPSSGWKQISGFTAGQEYLNNWETSPGNVGARYTNIGTYDGHPLDMVMTYTNWSNPHFISVHRYEAGGGYAVWGSQRDTNHWIEVTVSFQDHNTHQPVYVRGHELIWDIDQSEQFRPGRNIIRVIGDSRVGGSYRVEGEQIGSWSGGGASDDGMHAAVIFEGTDFTFYWSGRYFQLAANALFRAEVPAPEKAVSTGTAYIGTYYEYTITQYIPSDSFHYSYWNLTDTLPSCLSWGTGNVWITNENGANVTGWFNVSQSGTTLNVSSNRCGADDFYNHTYYIHVGTTVTANNLGNYTNGSGTYLNNSATATTNRSNKSTNTVTTEVLYNIETYIDRGTITPTISGTKGGTTHTIDFTPQSGYYISRVVVDGVEQDINNFNINGSSYTFEYITNNHKIEVYTTPKRIKVNLSKEDLETGKEKHGDAVLGGATYGLYRDDPTCSGSPIEILTTDANGYASSAEYNVVDGDTYHIFYLKEINPSTGYLIDQEIYTVEPEYTAQDIITREYSFTSKEQIIKNHIEIIKFLEETKSTLKNKLSGVVFIATLDSDTSVVFTSEPTDANGYTIIEDLPYGHWTIRETTIPSTVYDRWFVVDGKPRTQIFTEFIESDKSTSPTYRYGDINNIAKKMKITIWKEDAETGIITQGDATLDGAIYGIYRDAECTDEVERLTIEKNADGTHSAQTQEWYLTGNYWVKEIQPSTGYLIDEAIYPILVDPADINDEFIYREVTSKEYVKRNDIDITKYLEETDSTEKQKLAGAEFTAKIINQESPDKDKEYKATTDDNGHCVIEQIPYGTYRVWESNPPDVVYDATFYVQGSDTRVKTFDRFIELDDTEREPYTYSDITDVAKKMQIVIQKQDDETGDLTQGDAHLEGAEYTLYRDAECTDEIETVTIEKQEDGTYKAWSGWYLVGKYWVKETKAPEGYLIDETIYPVEQVPAEQTEEHSTHNVLSKDKVKEGLIKVVKFNNNSETSEKTPATGSRIRLTLDSNPDVYYDAVIDENGRAKFLDINDEKHSTTEDNCLPRCGEYTIPYGKYTIGEILVSDEHSNIFIDKQKTSIVEQDDNKQYILDEEYVTLKLSIKKVDAETGKVLPGEGTFKLWDEKRQEWYTEPLYPTGKIINEFVTGDDGFLTINQHIEAGSYILYETNAPYGYYLDDNLRVDNTGYRFAVGVGNSGAVSVWHGDEEVTLEYETQMYGNKPTKVYSWTAVVDDPPQKAIIDLTDLAEQFTKVNKENSKYGDVNTPEFEEKGLKDAEFDIIAKEDIYTEDGTKRYSQGEIVAHIKTDADGKASTPELYLGDFTVVQTNAPYGYIPSIDIPVFIEYTNQYERVQHIPVTIKNKKQDVEFSFEKEFKELETSKFKIEDKRATFGIFAAETIKNYRGTNTIAVDDLVEVIVVDENFQATSKIELPEGKYYVKEIDVSNPYILSTDVYDFTVEYTDNQDRVLEYTINRGKVTNIARTVYLELLLFPENEWDANGIEDINDEEELLVLGEQFGIENKVYGVYNDPECTNPVMTIDDEPAMFETDLDGLIKIPDMPTGIYYFKEIYAPYGYELSNEIIKAVVDGRTNVVLKAKEPLKKCQLLKKVDSFTGDVIPGVTYEITDSEEEVIFTGVTDETGILEVPTILFIHGDTYYYQEVDGPELYNLEKDKVEFTAKVDENCEWLLDTMKVENDRKTIEKVIVKKTDSETGDPLEGCVFTIVLLDEEGNEYVNAEGETIYLVKEGTTNADGEYVVENVPYGTYRFTEVKAPEGYELDEDMTGLEFTVDENSPDIIVFEVTNTGDIAVFALVALAIISIAGITYVIINNKKRSVRE